MFLWCQVQHEAETQSVQVSDVTTLQTSDQRNFCKELTMPGPGSLPPYGVQAGWLELRTENQVICWDRLFTFRNNKARSVSHRYPGRKL